MVGILSDEDCLKVLQRWKLQGGPTEEEINEFTITALAQLNDPEQLQSFKDDIGGIADLALDVDKTFNDVQQGLLLLTLLLPFPMALLYIQWVDFQKRWRACLRRSCEVASENIDILRRFDTVYLAKVENIQTEQDRIAAIQALEPFIVELDNNNNSAEMAREFQTLQRDIEAFITQFGLHASAFETNSRKEIEFLDQQIRSAQESLGIVGGNFLEALGLGARASSVVASLKAQRNKKAESLRDLQLTLVALNKLRVPQVQSQLRGFQPELPDIDLLLRRLVIFAETWLTVRSQTVQIREQLRLGLPASTNVAFKAEIRLARATCLPLMNGLAEYKAKLESWI